MSFRSYLRPEPPRGATQKGAAFRGGLLVSAALVGVARGGTRKAVGATAGGTPPSAVGLAWPRCPCVSRLRALSDTIGPVYAMKPDVNLITQSRGLDRLAPVGRMGRSAPAVFSRNRRGGLASLK